MRKFLLLFLMTGAAMAQSATTTTYTGVMTDLSQQPITSGLVTFTLAPSTDSTLPGTGRFIPSTINCNINVDGTLSGFVAGAVSGACFVTRNTAISPGGTAYRICIQANFSTPGSCWYDYATTATKDISTPAPTLSTGPINFGGVPGPPLDFQGAWSSGVVYSIGQVVSFSNLVYISLVNPNLGNTPSSSPSDWSVVITPASLLAAPTNAQTVTQPVNTSFNLLTSGTGSFLHNGNPVLDSIPVGSQAITQPANTDFNTTTNGTGKDQYNGNEIVTRANALQNDIATNQVITSLNGVLNAALFPGADIGAKVNAAITSLSGTCGSVYIPAGTYNFSTTINKPRCAKLVGAGSNSTTLNWTPTTGIAIDTVDMLGEFNWPMGYTADFTLTGPPDPSGGPVTTSSIGIFIGDQVGCSPCGFGDHQNFNNLRIMNFGSGVAWGNNAWNNNFTNVLIAENANGISFPSGLSNSGEAIDFYNALIGPNTTGINAPGFSDFYFYGGSCDFNGQCAIVDFAHFFGMHFEQETGLFITAGGAVTPNVSIFGGFMQYDLVSTTVTDPSMIFINSVGNPSFAMNDVFVNSNHPVTNLINLANMNPSGTNTVLSLIGNQVVNNIPSILNQGCTYANCNIIGTLHGTLIIGGATGVTKTCTVLPTVVGGIITSC